MAAKRGLLDDLYAARHSKPSKCGVQRALRELGDQADQLIQAINDRALEATLIAKVLKERGINIGADVIARHRRGVCNCEPR